MAHYKLPDPSGHAASLRRMNLLVVLLVLSNVATGVFGFFLLRQVDGRYSALIGQSVPALNDVRELAGQAMVAMRATNPREFPTPSASRSEALKDARARLEAERALRARLTTSPAPLDDAHHRNAIRGAGENFGRVAASVLKSYAAGNLPEAIREREESLLGLFDRYVAALGAAADRIEERSLAANKEYTARTRSLGTIVLGVAGWPLILLAGLLLVTAIFVLVLMFVFRGREMSDMP